ncbi:MAG: SIR2 family protein, partial [Mucilaginibacter sp.]
MKHILDIDADEAALYPLFEKIFDTHAILFLGAGASVGEKVYLSKQIIDYYEEYLGKSLNEPNITKFVDILSADPDFNRPHFDSEVEKLLRKLPVTEGHKILASIPWQEIITTNYYLLVERAYDDIQSSSGHIYDLVPVRELAKVNYRKSNSEVRYIKLNGCISDKSLYPLAFSTNDFSRLNKFYKNVLNELKSLSDTSIFISMGYSYSDEFGQQFLSKFDSSGYRERRWIYNVDPFPNLNALPFYTQEKICIIKCDFQEFFRRYKKWEDANLQVTVKRKKIVLSDNKLNPITIPSRLAINLDNAISQLNSNVREKYISELDFYK